jgi:hypothetical protein
MLLVLGSVLLVLGISAAPDKPEVAALAALPLAGFIGVCLLHGPAILFDPARRVATLLGRLGWRPNRVEVPYEGVKVMLYRTIVFGNVNTFWKDWHGWSLVVELAGRSIILIRSPVQDEVERWAEDLTRTAGIEWRWADEVRYEQRR